MALNVLVCPQRNPRAARIVAGVLATEADLRVAACATCAVAASPESPPPDVVVLTAGLPDMRDLAPLEAALRRHARVPVIVLGVYDDPQVTRRLLAGGARGFLTLDQAVGKLARMIRQTCRPAVRPEPGGLAPAVRPQA